MPRAVPALRVWGGYRRQRAGEARGSQKYTPAAALTAHTRPRAGRQTCWRGRGRVDPGEKYGINLSYSLVIFPEILATAPTYTTWI